MTILITLAIFIVALVALEISTQIRENRTIHPEPRD